MVKASIITIGDELLIGQVIDTNSAYISQGLSRIGIPVIRRVAVGDNKEAIQKALDDEMKHAGIILLTGGLGPTGDDITKPCLCEYFHGTLVVNKTVLESVRYRFETVLKRPMGERNARQAEVPDVCEVILNQVGTAPGMIFKKDGRIIISMPGVPHEMMNMLDNSVLPMLDGVNTSTIKHRTLLLMGAGESLIADLLSGFEASLPGDVSLAYLPDQMQLRLRLTAINTNDNALDLLFREMASLVKDYLVTMEDERIEQVIGKMLRQVNKDIAIAESCTGGFISQMFTSVPGSSAYFKGSVVSYSNDLKIQLLGVRQDSIVAHGAVSEQVAREMAEGIRKNFGTDYALAVSGIMGPGGGSEEKPVGTVFMAVSSTAGTEVRKMNLHYSRPLNIRATALLVLNLLRKHILQNS